MQNGTSSPIVPASSSPAEHAGRAASMTIVRIPGSAARGRGDARLQPVEHGFQGGAGGRMGDRDPRGLARTRRASRAEHRRSRPPLPPSRYVTGPGAEGIVDLQQVDYANTAS
jgi:hypothetical protein